MIVIRNKCLVTVMVYPFFAHFVMVHSFPPDALLAGPVYTSATTIINGKCLLFDKKKDLKTKKFILIFPAKICFKCIMVMEESI